MTSKSKLPAFALVGDRVVRTDDLENEPGVDAEAQARARETLLLFERIVELIEPAEAEVAAGALISALVKLMMETSESETEIREKFEETVSVMYRNISDNMMWNTEGQAS